MADGATAATAGVILPETVKNLMRYKGFEEELIHQIFVDSPREVLTKQ